MEIKNRSGIYRGGTDCKLWAIKMNYGEFREWAINSADIYYSYLDVHEKGYSSTEVRQVIVGEKGQMELFLVSSLTISEGVLVRIRKSIFSRERICPKHYDEKNKVLTVLPDENAAQKLLEAEPHEIEVISDLKFLVKRVRNWYDSHPSEITLPQYPPKISPAMPSEEPAPSEEQAAAFHGIFSAPFSYIWGAPGTGKTQFVLARAVLAYCREEKHILITAPTNNAVEQTLRGVLAVLETTEIPLEKVLRLGTPSREFYAKYPMVCETPNAEEDLEDVTQGIDQIQKHIAYEKTRIWFIEASGILHNCQEGITASEQTLAALEKESMDLRRSREIIEAKNAPLFTRLDRLTAKKKELQETLGKKRGFFTALFQKRTLQNARAELDATDVALQSIAREHEENLRQTAAISEKEKLLSDQIKGKKEEVRSVYKAALRTIPPCPYRFPISRYIEQHPPEKAEPEQLPVVLLKLIELERLLNEKAALYPSTPLEELEIQLQRLQKRKQALEYTMTARIQGSYVIAATVDGYIGRYKDFEDIKYHPAHVFLDEAAYCPLIKAAALLSSGAPVTLLGDHMQLPPVCEMSRRELKASTPAILWAQSALHLCDIYSKSKEEITADYLNDVLPNSSLFQRYELHQTFRFGQELAAVLEKYVYHFGFQGNERISTDLYVLHAPSSPSDKGNASVSEVEAIGAYLRDTDPQEEYAILTPFRQQRGLLLKKHSTERVFTVHGSQGREWDTVFLSVVQTSRKWFLTPRLVNTAVSRTKRRLIVVCDADYWEKQAGHIIGGLVSVGSRLLHTKKNVMH